VASEHGLPQGKAHHQYERDRRDQLDRGLTALGR